MKKFQLTAVALMVLSLGSCEKLYPAKYVTDIDDDVVWTVPDMAKGILFNAYYYRPDRSQPDVYDDNFLDVATDNAVSGTMAKSVYFLSQGRQTATDTPFTTYRTAYEQFQMIHRFMAKGLGDNLRYVEGDTEVAKASDKQYKSLLKGEAFYLRAWWGWHLLKHYGGRTTDGQALGYPIVTQYVTPSAAANKASMVRNTYAECVKQICDDCDSAAFHLSGKATITASDDYLGRATVEQAEFLKMRTLFLAAQPAYQDGTIIQINGMGDYTVLDQAAYDAKWQEALDQAVKVYTLLGKPVYRALLPTDLADVTNTTPGRTLQFVHRYYSSSSSLEARHYPPFYFGKCSTAPSQNLVDAFPMKANGYPITDPASGYDPANPYAGRDNRLERTVYRHGQAFGATGTVIDVVAGGKDSDTYMYNNSRTSATGYYLRKWLSTTPDLLDPVQGTSARHFWPTMRYAEVFFDIAEASNELYGPTTPAAGMTLSAYDIIKNVRRIAGGITSDSYLETVKGDKDAFFALLMNERRLEFAFENERYWDLRRRLLPLDQMVQGMRVTRDEAGALSYEVFDVERRAFDNVRYYYNPLPYEEVAKNPRMVNNMDY